MKTKNLIYVIGAICFGSLFYNQSVGLNYLLFVVFLLLSSTVSGIKKWQSPYWILVATGSLIASACTLYYANALTITMTVISVLLLLAMQRNQNNAFITSLSVGTLSVAGSLIFMILGLIDLQRYKTLSRVKSNSKLKFIKPVIIVLVISFIFLSLYRIINPVFDSYISKFSISISWGWFFTTILGFILLFTFVNFPNRTWRKLLKKEATLGKQIDRKKLTDHSTSFLSQYLNYDNERYSALLLFALLNIMLLLMNITDINQLFISNNLPKGVSYSDYVHNGVGALIASIVLAIALISFYFRGHINFDSKANAIKILTYIWLIQNCVLVLTAAVKNQIYIDVYSLTYKRIGVYFYLLFAIIGLLITIYKVYTQKDTWYLVKINSLTIFTILIISCTINWNSLICNFNTNRDKEIDYQYLCDLGYENYPFLWNANFFNNNKLYSTRYNYKLHLNGKIQQYNLPSEIGDFLTEYENMDLPSFCVKKYNVYNYFVSLAKNKEL